MDFIHVAVRGGDCLVRTAAILTRGQIQRRPSSTNDVPRASFRSGRGVRTFHGGALQAWQHRRIWRLLPTRDQARALRPPAVASRSRLDPQRMQM